jgi:hypothetical protein
MRTSVRRVGLVIAIAGVAIAIGLSIAQAQGPSGPTGPGSSGKQLPTPQSITVVHKHTTPESYISSCPSHTLPQPGVAKMALPNSDPTYAFENYAIGVSGGQPYAILAGYVRSKPSQGVILVQPISLDPCKDFVSHMQTPASTQNSASQASDVRTVSNAPSQDGAITLTGVSGNTVGYTTASGKSGHFDYVTKAFLP